MEKPSIADPLLPPAPPTAAPAATALGGPLPPYYAYPVSSSAIAADPLRSETIVLVPAYPVLRVRRRRRRRGCACRCCLLPLVTIALFAACAAGALWPSGATASVAGLRVDRIRVAAEPVPSLDVAFRLRLRVSNPNFLPLACRSVVASVAYRGRSLGSTSVVGGSGLMLEPRATARIDGDVWVDGAAVLDDAVYLIGDLASGSIPLDVAADVDGTLRVFSFEIPVKRRMSCSVGINPFNHEVIHQDCYNKADVTVAWI